MVLSIRPQIPVGASVESLVKGFVLTQHTDCKSPRTIEYYESNLRRFLWYAKKNEWPNNARLITEWHIREFLAYVSGEGNRWGLEGNGSESSRQKATYCTVHHYYCVLKAFFNWCVREGFIPETPLAKIKLKNPRHRRSPTFYRWFAQSYRLGTVALTESRNQENTDISRFI